MFHFAQDKSTTIEFLKSELMQLLSDMRQEIAASRQAQTCTACQHIQHCINKIQRAKSSVAIALPIESLDLEITALLRKQLLILPPEARKIWDHSCFHQGIMIEFTVSMINSNLGSILSGHHNTEGVATIFFNLWA